MLHKVGFYFILHILSLPFFSFMKWDLSNSKFSMELSFRLERNLVTYRPALLGIHIWRFHIRCPHIRISGYHSGQNHIQISRFRDIHWRLYCRAWFGGMPLPGEQQFFSAGREAYPLHHLRECFVRQCTHCRCQLRFDDDRFDDECTYLSESTTR